MTDCEKEKFLLLAFTSFLENSSDMYFFKDANLDYVVVSRSFAHMVGYENRADVVGKTDFDLFVAPLAKKYTEDDRLLLEMGKNIIEYIEPLPDEDGIKKYSSTSKFTICDERGQIIGLYGVSRDVTAQMELEAERESSRLSRQMFDDVLEADLTHNKMIVDNGSKLVNILGITEASLFSDTAQLFAMHLIHPEYVQEFLGYYDQNQLIARYKKGLQEFSHITYLRNGLTDSAYRWVQWRSRIYHSRVSGSLRITTFLEDIDETILNQQRLQREVATDALTGLHNRAGILMQIEEQLVMGTLGHSSALFFIDLDYFKQANDRWGHQFGDTVLQRTADDLRKIFEHDALFGRIGGDEFIVFLRYAPSLEGLEHKAAETISKIAYQYGPKDNVLKITCSIGVAIGQVGVLSAEELCERADKAMYYAKENGRNQYAFYEKVFGRDATI